MALLNFTENSTVMQAMDTFGIYVPNKYLQALVLLVAVYLVSKIFVWIVKTVVLAATSKTKTKTDDLLAEKSKGPVSWLLITIGARFALLPLEMEAGEAGIIAHILNTASILIITVLVVRVVDIFISQWGKKWASKTESSLDDVLLPIIQKASKAVLAIFGLFFVLTEWNIDVTGVLAGMGIAGLALGFAVKDSLANIFGGISLLLDKAVKVGDFVEVNGISGEVLDVGLRSTRIKTWDNELLIMPNGTLANSEFKNWKLPDIKARIVIDFGVEYGAKIDKVKKLTMDVIKKHKNIMKDPEPVVRFNNMADSALMFGAYFWVEDISEKLGTKDKVLTDLYNALNKAKIGIPFPQMDVHLKKR